MSAAPRLFDESQARRQVLQIRYWQLLMNELLKQPGRFRIPIHCALGHEAVAVATRLAMRPGDRLVLTHRNMAFQFAHAGSFDPVALEYELSAAGVSAGRLGSMNMMNRAAGLVYSSSILGNNLPVACGLAMAMRAHNPAGRVTVLTGDGAIEEGAFWESLVFARSHSLNLVFLVENNNHSLASTIAERRCGIDLARLAAALDIPYTRLESNQPAEYAAALAAPAGMPVLCEAMVHTYCNHAGATPGWPADPKSISLAGGLELEASPRDPVHVARRSLGEEEYAATSRFLAALATAVLAGQNQEAPCQTTT